MKRVKVITVGESIQAIERNYIEFAYFDPQEVLSDVIGEYDKHIAANVKLAPVHRICELGKPDLYLAIEPKLYDLITDVKISKLESSLLSEQHRRDRLEKDIDRLTMTTRELESYLANNNSRIGYFNDLPWYKRIFRKV